METYTRLFSGIIRSTIWDEPHSVRIVWITMLALADREGTVYGSVPGLAHEARVSIDECTAALDRLGSKDEYSRTPEDEGRRIRTVDGGWKLINHAKYRDAGGEKELNRQRQQRSRDRKKGVTLRVTPVTDSNTESPPTPAPAPTPTPTLSEGTSPGEKFNARSYRTRLFEMLPGHARLGPLDVDAAIAEQMRDGDVDGDLIVERTAAFYRSPKGRADVYRNTKPATFIRRGGYLEPDKAWQDPDKSSGGGSTPVYDTSRRDQQRAEDERVLAERKQETQ